VYVFKFVALPLVKVVPNLLTYSLYVVTIVGTSTGPLTVGPIIAAPTVTGLLDTKDESFSLGKTPGEIKVSAIFYFI
jgi:hypothetical protein